VRLLPKLDTIQLSGLPGTRVKELIAFSQRLGCTVKRWIVKWDENRRGRDVVLDRLVEKGWRDSWNTAGLKPESEVDEAESEVDEVDDKGSEDKKNDSHGIRIDAYQGSDDEESDDEAIDEELSGMDDDVGEDQGNNDDDDDDDDDDDNDDEAPPQTPAVPTSSLTSSSPSLNSPV